MRVRRAVDLCPDSDAALFKRAVKGVIKLSVEPRADVHRPRATPLRRARREEAPLPVAAPALSDDFEPAVLTDEEGSVFPHPHIRRDIVRNSGAASGALRRNWICTICAALKRARRSAIFCIKPCSAGCAVCA